MNDTFNPIDYFSTAPGRLKLKLDEKDIVAILDKEGQAIDFLLRVRRDAVAAKAFFRKAFRRSTDNLTKSPLIKMEAIKRL